MAIPKILYTAGIIDWTITELEELDRTIRKSMCKKMFIMGKSDADRLYVKRSEGGRGLISVSEAVQYQKKSLVEYCHKSNNIILYTITKNYKKEDLTSKEYKILMNEKHKEQWNRKELHGQYIKELPKEINFELSFG